MASTASPGLSQQLRSAFARTNGRVFEGFVLDLGDLSRRFIVELVIDGQPAQVTRADAYVHELAAEGLGDGRYGFSFTVTEQVVSDGIVLEARLANVGTILDHPIFCRTETPSNATLAGPGNVTWLGGLHFKGWVNDIMDMALVNAILDGEIVAKANASGWSHTGTTRAVRSFELFLPGGFADGRVHRVTVEIEGGRELPGSPISFVAFADGLEQTIARLGGIESERLRGALFDRIVPNSIPFTEYEYWNDRFAVPAPVSEVSPIALVLVGDGDVDLSIRSLREQQHPDWCVASLPHRGDQISFNPKLVLQFLAGEAHACNAIVFALAGTKFSRFGLQRILAAFSQFTKAQAVYGDIEMRGDDGSIWPIALSAFDYERMLEQGYCAYLSAFRRPFLTNALSAGCSDLIRQFNMLFDETGPFSDLVIHIPGVLGTLPAIEVELAQRTLRDATAMHLHTRGIACRVISTRGEVFPAVHVQRAVEPATVSIIIPTRNRLELLRTCIELIAPAAGRLSAEILIIDNDTTDPDTKRYLIDIDRRIATVIVNGPFNFARLNNIAAGAARGQVLCLLNNDVQARDEDWMSEMLSLLSEPDVGAVGALLLWPSGVVQHGGVVLGAGFAKTHAFNDRIEGDPGYGDLLLVAHETSCVTAACMLLRREDYIAVGGMDELRFPVAFNDVDLCLKLRAAGKRIVFTPHARLLHLESASRGHDDLPDRVGRSRREIVNLRGRWGEFLVADPISQSNVGPRTIPVRSSRMAASLNGTPCGCATSSGGRSAQHMNSNQASFQPFGPHSEWDRGAPPNVYRPDPDGDC